MTPETLGLIFAAVAAVAWAALDAVRKRASDMGAVVVVAWFNSLQGPLFLAWMSVDPWPFDLAYLAPGATCLALNVAANVLFVRAVEVSPLSRTVPFLAFGPVFATMAAIPLLGEFPSWGQLLGIGLVVSGALAVNAGRSEGRGLLALLQAARSERGSVMMIGAALFWALSLVVDKLALLHSSKAGHGWVQTGGVGAVLVIYMLARGRAKELASARHRFPILLVAAIVATIGIALQLLALEQLMAAVVGTLKRGVGIVSSLVIGRVFFKESIDRWQMVAVTVLIGGTVLLMLE